MSRLGRMWASFKNRKRYDNLKQCPTALLFTGMVLSAPVAAASGYILTDVGPAYIKAFNRIHGWSDFGVTGIASTVVMLALFVHTWFFGGLADGCRKILNERIFG